METYGSEALRRLLLFERFGAAELGEIWQACHVRHYPARRRIARQEDRFDDLLFVLDGGLRGYLRTASGWESSVRLLKAPIVCGVAELLAGRTRWQETLEAVVPSVVASLDRATFMRLVWVNRQAQIVLVRELASSFLNVRNVEQQQGTGSSESRLASLLLEYGAVFGRANLRGECEIHATLNQELMARSLGLSRKTVNQTLGSWARRAIVVRRDRQYVIRDSGALAGFESEG